MLEIAWRAREGLPIYRAPSIAYTPFIYTPLYYYAVAAMSWLTGLDFIAGRLISFLASLGAAALICRWVRREGGGWLSALAATGLFFAAYKISGRWFELARTDSLFLFLILAGFYLLAHGVGRKSALAAAALLSLAFMTKQSLLMIALPAFIFGMFWDFRRVLLAGASFAFLTGAWVLYYHGISDGWFTFYVFEVPAGHSLVEDRKAGFFLRDMKLFGIAVLLAAAVITHGWRQPAMRRKSWLYAGIFTGMLAGAYFSRLHSGGYVNVLIPAYAAASLFAGVAAAWAQPRKFGYIACLMLIICQMALRLYYPAPLIPGPEDYEAGARFEAYLREVKGKIFIPEMQFVPTRAGKKSYLYSYAVHDVLRAHLRTHPHVQQKLRRELRQAFRQQRFAAVILDSGSGGAFPGMHRYYVFKESINGNYGLWPKTGLLLRPNHVFVPKQNPP